MRAGDKGARDALWLVCQTQVHLAAMRLSSMTPVPYEELVSEGQLAVGTALDSFKFNKGARLGTHLYNQLRTVLKTFIRREYRESYRKVSLEQMCESTSPAEDL